MSNTILGAAASLAEDRTWDVNLKYPKEVFDTSLVNNRRVSGLPPGASVIAVPLHPLARFMTHYLPNTWVHGQLFQLNPKIMNNPTPIIDTEFQFTSPALIYWYQIIAATLIGGFAAAASMLVLSSVLKQLGIHSWTNAVFAFFGVFGTSLFTMTTVYSKEGISSFLILLSIAHIFFWSVREPEKQSRQWNTQLLGGMPAGLAIAVNYPCAFIVALCLALLLIRRRFWTALNYIGGVIPIVLLLLYYHAGVFGGPFTSPYAFREIEPWAHHHTGFLGLSLPHTTALYGMTFGSLVGCFSFNPILLLSLPLCFVPGTHQNERRLVGISFCLLLFAYAGAEQILVWSGGFAGAGLRHLVFLFPLFTISLGAFATLSSSRVFLCLAILSGALSFGIQLLSVTWGGTLFPDANVNAMIFVNKPEVLDHNALATLWHTTLESGFVSPLLRVYEMTSAEGTIVTLLLTCLLSLGGLWNLRRATDLPA